MDIIKFLLGISIYAFFLLAGNRTGNKKYDNYMIFFIFASIGLRSFFCVLPDLLPALRYLQSSWYLYLSDIPLIYFMGRSLNYDFGVKCKRNVSPIGFLLICYIVIAFFSIFQAVNKYTAFWGACNLIKFLFLCL